MRGLLGISDQKESNMGRGRKPDPETMRAWLYHPDAPRGKIFTGKAEIDKAMKAGWVDSRRKLKPAAAASGKAAQAAGKK